MNAYTQVMSDRFEVVVPSAPEGWIRLSGRPDSNWRLAIELLRVMDGLLWSITTSPFVFQEHHIS